MLGGTEMRAEHTREFYQLRRYFLQSGPQLKLTETYLSSALIPALTRMGMGPVGAFRVDIGPETPTYDVLIQPRSGCAGRGGSTPRAGCRISESSRPFWMRPPRRRPFNAWSIRCSRRLKDGRSSPAALIATKAKRISSSAPMRAELQSHVVKVQMFHSGEFEIFRNAGFHMVFFGDTLAGPRLPNLTYMLSFAD